MTQYADWKAPKADAATLIWPDAGRLIEGLAANRQGLDEADVRVQNVPLAEWRTSLRAAFGYDDGRPTIATGHQIELYHPGVWVKNVLLDAVARKTDARALHVAVDTDSPKHLQVRWPGGAVDLSDDVLLHTGAWSGQVARPSPQHLKRLSDRFAAASADWSFTPSVGPVFDALAADRPIADKLPQNLLDACRALDVSLGLSYETRRLSTLLDTDAYLAFVHHVAADIDRYADVYNRSLADYRREAGITGDTRPMPDLRVRDDAIELPFWFDRLDTGDRSRATAVRDNGRWHLLTESAAFAFDPSLPGDVAAARFGAFCREHHVRLAPRALTLTTFLRLFVVDQFVHGIGGGRYDQVTDRILEAYFRLPAPAFAVTTATLYFPDAGERDAECVPCLINEGHRLRHNTVAKNAYLDAIAAAPRRSATRRAAYAEMHGRLQRESAVSRVLAEWRETLDRAVERREREAVLFDRELFYAIQPHERLKGLIDAVRTAITRGSAA